MGNCKSTPLPKDYIILLYQALKSLAHQYDLYPDLIRLKEDGYRYGDKHKQISIFSNLKGLENNPLFKIEFYDENVISVYPYNLDYFQEDYSLVTFIECLRETHYPWYFIYPDIEDLTIVISSYEKLYKICPNYFIIEDLAELFLQKYSEIKKKVKHGLLWEEQRQIADKLYKQFIDIIYPKFNPSDQYVTVTCGVSLEDKIYQLILDKVKSYQDLDQLKNEANLITNCILKKLETKYQKTIEKQLKRPINFETLFLEESLLKESEC